MQALEARGIEALIADNRMRQRDERFADRARHKAKPDPLHDKPPDKKKPARFTSADFHFDPLAQTCLCQAGKPLYRNGSNVVSKGYRGTKFRGAARDCKPCAL